MIDITNYETWFLLYADNELSAEEKLTVLSFVQQHPTLQQELDGVLQLRFYPDSQNNKIDKSSLSSNSIEMKMEAALKQYELLIEYVDGELSETKLSYVEHRLNQDADFNSSYKEILALKLQSDRSVFYPQKEELYKRSNKIRLIWKKPMAIAASLLIAFGFLWIFFGGNTRELNAVGIVSKENDTVQSKEKKSSVAVNSVARIPIVENKKDKSSLTFTKKQPTQIVDDLVVSESIPTELAPEEKELANTVQQQESKKSSSNNLPIHNAVIDNNSLVQTAPATEPIVVESLDETTNKARGKPFKLLSRKISRILGKDRDESDQIKFIQVANIQFAVSKQ